jgi:hypothetical protein
MPTMKRYLILFLLFYVNTCFSQEVRVLVNNKSEYSFVHGRVMDEMKKERYSVRMLNDCEALESIVFTDGICKLVLKENINADLIDRSLLYCISKFGFTNYKIELQ